MTSSEDSGKPPERDRTARNSDPGTLWYYVGFAWTLGWSIAVPAVAFLFAGRWLDKRFGTEPWLMLVAVILSLFVTSAIVVVKTRSIIADIESLTRKAESGKKSEKKTDTE